MTGKPNVETLRERRLAAGVSQETVARAANVSLHTYRLYENGYRAAAGSALGLIEVALEQFERDSAGPGWAR